jgi:hypothetical protein
MVKPPTTVSSTAHLCNCKLMITEHIITNNNFKATFNYCKHLKNFRVTFVWRHCWWLSRAVTCTDGTGHDRLEVVQCMRVCVRACVSVGRRHTDWYSTVVTVASTDRQCYHSTNCNTHCKRIIFCPYVCKLLNLLFAENCQTMFIKAALPKC